MILGRNEQPRLTWHIESQAFESNLLIAVDVGARGGFETHWSNYNGQVRLIGFEPDEEECRRLNNEMNQVREDILFSGSIQHTG